MSATTHGPVDLMDYDEAIARFDPVFGIEVHVELGTRTKMFDSAPQVFGAEPNTAVSPRRSACRAPCPSSTAPRSSTRSGSAWR